MDKRNKNLSVKYFKAAAEAAQEAGKALEELLLKYYRVPTLLMLSGGSALNILDEIDENVLGEQLTVAMLDDRFSQDPTINNFARFQETDFYQKALERDCSFIGTLGRKNESMEGLAKRFEASLKNWRAENSQGKIAATLGMGKDGHTAGIMPFPEDKNKFKELFKSKAWAAAYNAGSKNPYPERITTTLAFLTLIDEAVGFVTGAEKKPALDKVLSGTGEIYQLPALAWRQMKKVQIFTDIP